MRGLALCYLPQAQPWSGRLAGALAVAGLRVRRLQAEETGETVGYLAGIPGFEKAPEGQESGAEDVHIPVILFSGLGRSGMDAALGALRRLGVPREVYKAVVTGENATWTFASLCRELERERQAIAGGEGSPHREGG